MPTSYDHHFIIDLTVCLQVLSATCLTFISTSLLSLLGYCGGYRRRIYPYCLLHFLNFSLAISLSVPVFIYLFSVSLTY